MSRCQKGLEVHSEGAHSAVNGPLKEVLMRTQKGEKSWRESLHCLSKDLGGYEQNGGTSLAAKGHADEI